MDASASVRPPGTRGGSSSAVLRGADNDQRLLEFQADGGGSGPSTGNSFSNSATDSDNTTAHPIGLNENNVNGSGTGENATPNTGLAGKNAASVGSGGSTATTPPRSYSHVVSMGTTTTTITSMSGNHQPSRPNEPRRSQQRFKNNPKRGKRIQLVVRINYPVTRAEAGRLQTHFNQLGFIEKCTRARLTKDSRPRLQCTIFQRNVPLLVKYLEQNDEVQPEGRTPNFWSLQPEGEHFVLRHRYHFAGAQTLTYKQLRQILEKIWFRVIPDFNAEQWTKLMEDSSETVPQVFKGMCALQMLSKLSLFVRFERLLSAKAPILIQYAQRLIYRSPDHMQPINIRPEINMWSVELWGANTEAEAIQVYEQLQTYSPLQPFLRGIATPVAPKRYYSTGRSRNASKGNKGITPQLSPKRTTTNTLVGKHFRVMIAGFKKENPETIGQSISAALGNDIIWNGIFLYQKALARRSYAKKHKRRFFENIHGQPRPMGKGLVPPHVCRHCGVGHATRHCGALVSHMGDLTVRKQLARAKLDHQDTEAWLQQLQEPHPDMELATEETPLSLAWTEEQVARGERLLAANLETYGIPASAYTIPDREQPRESERSSSNAEDTNLAQRNDVDTEIEIGAEHTNRNTASVTLASPKNGDRPTGNREHDTTADTEDGSDTSSTTSATSKDDDNTSEKKGDSVATERGTRVNTPATTPTSPRSGDYIQERNGGKTSINEEEDDNSSTSSLTSQSSQNDTRDELEESDSSTSSTENHKTFHTPAPKRKGLKTTTPGMTTRFRAEQDPDLLAQVVKRAKGSGAWAWLTGDE